MPQILPGFSIRFINSRCCFSAASRLTYNKSFSASCAWWSTSRDFLISIHSSISRPSSILVAQFNLVNLHLPILQLVSFLTYFCYEYISLFRSSLVLVNIYTSFWAFALLFWQVLNILFCYCVSSVHSPIKNSLQRFSDTRKDYIPCLTFYDDIYIYVVQE